MLCHTLGCAVALVAAATIPLSIVGCKKTERSESPLVQVGVPEPETPPAPVAPSDPVMPSTPPENWRGPADRAEAVQTTLALMSEQRFAEALKYLAKDIEWVEVGLPEGELTTVPAIVDYMRRSWIGFSNVRVKAKRILVSANYVAVEYVWSGRHDGALADGTPPTHRVVTLPVAMLQRYDTRGLIDRVWVFQDWPNVLQQLGLAPGLPDGFEPVAMPERVEIVEEAPALSEMAERYRELSEGFARGRWSEELLARTTEDFTWRDALTGRAHVGHGEVARHIGYVYGMFAPRSNEVGVTLAAGPYLVAFVSQKLLYAGGFMGVPSADQRIDAHTLDVARFDPESGRLESLTRYCNTFELLAPLQLGAGGVARPTPKRGDFNVEPCDDYIAHVLDCLESFDGDERRALEEELAQRTAEWRANLRDGPEDGVARACELAIDEARDILGDSCPRVDWD